ncbi:MAG: VWA domain-containing protein [SAR324 cluster bacterium]|nr:VWA domain-containing protein [SAR324 cluster bacterium]
MKIDPWFAIVSIGVCLIFVIVFLWQKRSGRLSAALQFSNVHQLRAAGLSWRVRSYWMLSLLRLLAIAFLLFGFLRPQKGLEVVRSAREGVAIQMVIDRSSSMKEALTYQGQELDRLEVVKRVFESFILGDQGQMSGRPVDMIGLSSFAGFVEENAPLTLDHATLVNFARTIRPAGRLEDGTMIGDAIYFATLRLISVDELLRKAGEKDKDYRIKSKIIIILTDGQQTQGGMNPLEAASFSKDNDIKVYTIAITSDSQYTRKDSLFGGIFSLMDRRLDTTLLEKVASVTGGVFARASSGEELLRIYQKIDQLEKSKFEERFTTYKEQFPFFVTIGLSLFLLELLLSLTLFRKIP